MLEATSFEKINAVKKWTGMENKQCNGICPFNSSDLLQFALQQFHRQFIRQIFVDHHAPRCVVQAFMQICLTRSLSQLPPVINNLQYYTHSPSLVFIG
ncbi:uncharacterized protein LOC141886878 isoform X2 [Acropora palmata]|uniref:uncharacterized protein LOC141886878 isoform X2 n=1 Tax=Acropora palmata TaxID=6131 RepID=UPI003DA0F74B